jgi:hypothetical protein
MADPLHNNDMRAVHAHPCDGPSVLRGTVDASREAGKGGVRQVLPWRRGAVTTAHCRD